MRSFLRVSKWIHRIGKGLPWKGVAPGFNLRWIGSLSQSPKVPSKSVSNSRNNFKRSLFWDVDRWEQFSSTTLGRSAFSYLASRIFTVRSFKAFVTVGSSNFWKIELSLFSSMKLLSGLIGSVLLSKVISLFVCHRLYSDNEIVHRRTGTSWHIYKSMYPRYSISGSAKNDFAALTRRPAFNSLHRTSLSFLRWSA